MRATMTIPAYGRELLLAYGQHYQAAHGVLQHSDVVPPRVLAKQGQGLGREPLLSSVLGVESIEKPGHQRRDLLASLAQRGNSQLDHVESVIQILAELQFGERLLEISIGGGDHAGVDLDLRVAADA